jgi:hypothetical protein
MAKQDKADTATAGMGDGPSFTIGGRYRVLPESRLPEFDLGSAEAVVALDDRYPDEPVFARICGPISLPRVEMMDNLKHMKDAAVLRPLEWGP